MLNNSTKRRNEHGKHNEGDDDYSGDVDHNVENDIGDDDNDDEDNDVNL